MSDVKLYLTIALPLGTLIMFFANILFNIEKNVGKDKEKGTDK